MSGQNSAVQKRIRELIDDYSEDGYMVNISLQVLESHFQELVALAQKDFSAKPEKDSVKTKTIG